MKNDIESRVKKFHSLLEPIAKGASLGKRQYMNNLLEEIASEINFQELSNNSLRAKLSGCVDYNEYNTALDKCLAILWFFGMTSVEFNIMRKDILEWMRDNADGLKRPTTWPELIKIYRFVEHFETFEDRKPKDFNELKEYISNDKD